MRHSIGSLGSFIAYRLNPAWRHGVFGDGLLKICQASKKDTIDFEEAMP